LSLSGRSDALPAIANVDKHKNGLEFASPQCNCLSVKTVSKDEAAESFETLGDLVHSGETVLVVDGGKPWLRMVPASGPSRGKTTAEFKARLARISRKPIPGVAGVLKRTRR